MSPPRVSSADKKPSQSPEQIAEAIIAFLAAQAGASVLEDGKVAFDLSTAQYKLSTEHGRCTLHLWSGERSVVRTVVAAEAHGESLKLTTQRLGQAQTKRMELVAAQDARATKRSPTARDRARREYQRSVERMLPRYFPDWEPEGLRTAMDLERSFGPAYLRGSLVRGSQAWALVAVSELESMAIIDGALTVGILWLDHCREHGAGRMQYDGLRLIVPRGAAMLTAARMAWLNAKIARWELWELDRASEELVQRDLEDRGNLRTRLIHRPDERAAQERFASAVAEVMELVPQGDAERVEQHLRSSTELAFLLHGLEFARARVEVAATGFSHTLKLTVGVGASETELTSATHEDLRGLVADLFARRCAGMPAVDFGARRGQLSGRIGSAAKTEAAHSRMNLGTTAGKRRIPTSQDPLYRAAPEKWLESVLRADLKPLTRGLASRPEARATSRATARNANDHADLEADTRGNRADADGAREVKAGHAWPNLRARAAQKAGIIPRLDPQHLYSQVSAIAGAGDKGLLDLLGVTHDGRLAVIEIKADDDMHFALQGLDYWIRVRHHHATAPDAATGMGEFQRNGYFREVELSPMEPRLFLVAPALRIHPATETVLRYLSPRVEWELLALDERWRQQVRVVWRRGSKQV
ncbi:hypothetical protein SAMN05421819_3893 [Bryocella elongata]|uniref:Uncharacterized protein n=1 Tax=Bryocella elongata TaxID=863522 RepID=A0A1H6BPW9_9BACT|nr:hypothetical protein [Bryocella elongata]SEG62447.1 hypothetical protein SAMN05421819_3893 [Bryocella elongata]